MIVNEVFSVVITTATEKNHIFSLEESNELNKDGISFWTGNYGLDGDKVTVQTSNPNHPMTISYSICDGQPYGKVHISIA